VIKKKSKKKSDSFGSETWEQPAPIKSGIPGPHYYKSVLTIILLLIYWHLN